jgi:mevalonate kinase
MSITASAPGKLLLFGDHAVVYNHPCLVTAVDLRVRVSASTGSGDDLEISAEGQGLSATRRVPIQALLAGQASPNPETAFVEAAAAQVLQLTTARGGLRIETRGPAESFGLGSSSAVTVATIAAVAELLGLKIDARQMFQLGYAAVLAVQGTGSGFDVASAVYGGTLFFVTGGAEIEPLTIPDLPLVIGYSGSKVSTRALVEQVARLRARQGEVVGGIFELIEHITRHARAALIGADWGAAGELMNLQQGLLDALGVNVPRLATPIFAAREAGASGAKLSGAGGGDCMFALAERGQHPAIKQALEQAGARIVEAQPNAEGVRIERG